MCYNNKDLLEDFLPKVLATRPDRSDVGIFVIDNASTDGTHDFLDSFGEQIHIISIEKNRGFTNGYKVGLAQINAEIFCLLSSDVEVSENWIEPVLSLFDEHKKLAIVQPKIKSWHHKDEFEYAGACGGYIDKLGYPFCRGRIFYDIEKDEGQYNEPQEIFWASGACFFIRAKLYENSGGLDDDFYAHMEEIDLCWRLKNQGYKVMVCPQSEVYHVGGAVISYGSPQKVYRNHRNNLIMMMKNYSKEEVFQKIVIRLIMDAPAFINMLVRGQVRASFSIISAHWNFFWNLPKWIKKRKEIQREALHHTSSGVYQKSIVADYFLRGKKKFSDLGWKP